MRNSCAMTFSLFCFSRRDLVLYREFDQFKALSLSLSLKTSNTSLSLKTSNSPSPGAPSSEDLLNEDGFVLHVFEEKVKLLLVVVPQEDPALPKPPPLQAHLPQDHFARSLRPPHFL